MSDRVSIGFEVCEDGWVLASVPAARGVHSQGRTREEARANVIDALRGMPVLRARCTYLDCRHVS